MGYIEPAAAINEISFHGKNALLSTYGQENPRVRAQIDLGFSCPQHNISLF